MGFRTDVTYRDGKLVANNPPGSADLAKPLPKVDAPDLLASDKYGDSWRKEAGTPDAAIEALASAHGAIARSFNSAMQIRERRDPGKTQAAHLSELAASFDHTLSTLAANVDRAKQSAERRLVSLNDEFKQAVKWREQDTAELRAVVRSMSKDERSKLIGDAIANADGQVLGALLGGHPSLSGLTHEQHAALRREAMMKHAPHLAKLEKVLQSASKQASEAFQQLLARADGITAAELRKQYAAEAAAAREAREALKAQQSAMY